MQEANMLYEAAMSLYAGKAALLESPIFIDKARRVTADSDKNEYIHKPN